MKKILLALIVSAIFLASGQVASASTLYLSPASGTVGLGGTISVRVNLNTAGEAVNGVSAILNYPADKLEVAGISYSSTFGIAAEGTSGGGAIRISRGNINPVSGNVNVATIKFRGKAAGATTVSFVGGSAVPRASDSSDSYTGGSGGTYTISSTPAATQTPTTGTQPSPITDTKGPEISNLNVENIAMDSATISWQTNEPSDSFIEYGLESQKYFLNASDGNLVSSHILKLEGPQMTAGSNYYFIVRSKDSSGNETISEERSFQLNGFTLRLQIKDELGRPLANIEVYLYSDPIKGVTDAKGEVIFKNVTAGKHLVVVKFGNFEKTSEIEVKDDLLTQNVDLKIDTKGQVWAFNKNLIVIGFVVILVTGLIVFIILKKRGSKPPFMTPPLPTA